MTTPAKLAPQRGTLPVLQYCTPDQLGVDPLYQRDLDARSRQLINRIAGNWDWNLFQPLVVARRDDGRLFVVDGQHRLAAARLRRDVMQLPCVIFASAAPAEEADVFVKLNQERRPLSAYALYNAALATGDEAAIALDTILRQTGWSFVGGADTRRCSRVNSTSSAASAAGTAAMATGRCAPSWTFWPAPSGSRPCSIPASCSPRSPR